MSPAPVPVDEAAPSSVRARPTLLPEAMPDGASPDVAPPPASRVPVARELPPREAEPRDLTPPDGSPSARPLLHGPRAWPDVVEALVDKTSRRALRLAIAVLIFKLQVANKMAPEVLLGLSVCAVGVEAAVRAARERKAAVAAAVLLPVALGGAGHLLHDPLLAQLGTYLTALGLPLSGWLAHSAQA